MTVTNATAKRRVVRMKGGGTPKRNMLKSRMLQNYTDIADFIRRTGIPLASETLRRAIYEGKPIAFPTLIVLMKYLGFSANEIRDVLKDMGETDFSSLIGQHVPSSLDIWERAWLTAGKRLREADPTRFNSLLDAMRIYAEGTGIDISKELEVASARK